MSHTVFAPFSRPWAIDRFFDTLALSDVPFADCHFTAYVDHDDQAVVKRVRDRAKELPWLSVTVKSSGQPPAGNTDSSGTRRTRQALMRQASFDLIRKRSERLLLLEDDTTVPPQVWAKLGAMLDSGYDWATGFEVCRWNLRCAGVWRIGHGKIESMLPKQATVEPCDASGVYCAMTTPAVYMRYPWDVMDPTYGQDVTVTYRLHLDGLKLGVDWSCQCIHFDDKRDYRCEDVVRYVRKVAPLRLVHIDTIDSKRVKPKAPPKRYTMGKTVELDGTRYAKGSRITADTARAMYAAGLITTVIP